jgi:hypothetical protein
MFPSRARKEAVGPPPENIESNENIGLVPGAFDGAASE